MRKFLLGISALVSMTFLAACGGGGAGSSGSAGADGASGAAGTIALFEDADLQIHFNGGAGALPGVTPTVRPVDTGVTIGQISGAVIITGTDNLTEDSKQVYRLYTATANSVKRVLGTTVGEAGVRRLDTSATDGILDTRHKLVDNITLSLTDYTLPEQVRGAANTTAAIAVCPSNEAGDGACSSILAPLDRGAAVGSVGDNITADTHSSIAYGLDNASVGSFYTVSDNVSPLGQGVHNLGSNKFTPTRLAAATAATVSTNASLAVAGGFTNDNMTSASNVIVIGTNHFVAYTLDNATSPAGVLARDNVTLAVAPNSASGGEAMLFIDNDTINTLVASAALTTPLVLEANGEIPTLLMGRGTAITAYSLKDNGTAVLQGAPYALTGLTIGSANEWCSTVAGAMETVVAHVNLATGTGLGITQIRDNGSTTQLGTTSAANGLADNLTTGGSGHTSIESCDMTHNAGTTHLVISDDVAVGLPDVLTVWKSTDLTTWSQIGDNISLIGESQSMAIASVGTSDDSVYVAVNDNGSLKLLHYEDTTGGTTNVWRDASNGLLLGANKSGRLLAGAIYSPVSLASDGASTLGLSTIVDNETAVGFWYTQ